MGTDSGKPKIPTLKHAAGKDERYFPRKLAQGEVVREQVVVRAPRAKATLRCNNGICILSLHSE